MISYLTCLDAEYSIVPHHVRHLVRLGATTFRITVYGTEADMATVCDMVRQERAEPQPLGVLGSATFSARRREAFIAEHHERGQWAFFCDADEFPDLTPQQVRDFTQSKAPYVAGQWRDRIAPGGKLRDVRHDQTIEQQYPCTARLRQEWRMGASVFVLSPRAPTLHHPNACRWGRVRWPNVPIVDVDHYRWQTNVVPRLERRLARIEAIGKQHTPWYRRVQKMLEHLREYDGIDPLLLDTPQK